MTPYVPHTIVKRFCLWVLTLYHTLSFYNRGHRPPVPPRPPSSRSHRPRGTTAAARPAAPTMNWQQRRRGPMMNAPARPQSHQPLAGSLLSTTSTTTHSISGAVVGWYSGVRGGCWQMQTNNSQSNKYFRNNHHVRAYHRPHNVIAGRAYLHSHLGFVPGFPTTTHSHLLSPPQKKNS